MKLHEAIKGMEVKSWERRENSNGKCTVYVRFGGYLPPPRLPPRSALSRAATSARPSSKVRT